ncbi:MAG: glucosyltransferase domain-containing protein [Eubacteriales bacterium]|nr:glucosyltransferase domain-containing protein [Eubacteriales bacterium]
MEFLEQKVKSIPRNLRICLCSGLLFGFLTHLFMLTNKLSNWDDLSNFNGYGVGGELGRWVLRFVHPLATKLSNPWVNGSLAILLISVACTLIYAILGLRTRVSAVLLPMIFMTFPSLASTMTFMFTVDLYAIGLLLAVLAAYLAIRCRYGFIWGMIPLILSLGIYQAYVCFTITLLLLRWIGDEIDRSAANEPFSIPQTVKKAISYAVMLGAGTGLYIVIAHLRYPLLGSETHNGVGEMGQINPLRVPVYCAKALLRVLKYFTGGYSFQTSFVAAVNVLAVLLVIVLFLFVAKRAALFRNRARALWTVLLALLFPIAISFIDIMSPDANFSMLMLYQYAFVYVLLLCLGERWENREKTEDYGRERELRTEKQQIGTGAQGECVSASETKTARPGQSISGRSLLPLFGILLILASSYGDYVVTGEAYFRMDLTYERVYGYFDRMIEKVEAQEGYSPEDSIYILGTFDENTINSYALEEERFYDFSGVALEYGLITPGTRENFLRIYFGKPVENSMSEEGEAIRASEEYRVMTDYPADGSIARIGDAWVVRISE